MLSESKIFNLIGFFVSLYKEKFTNSLSSSQMSTTKCNVHLSRTLQPLYNLFEFINTKLYINLLFLFHVFLTNLSCFAGFSSHGSHLPLI